MPVSEVGIGAAQPAERAAQDRQTARGEAARAGAAASVGPGRGRVGRGARWGARFGAFAMGVLYLSHAEIAAADNAECGAAYVRAQQLMRRGELREARGELIVCAKDCLPEVQRDCTTWLTEVGSSIPTLVVVALDAQGRELADVAVEIDAERRAPRLDGRALEVDPGKRRLKLRRGEITKQVVLTVLQGEKNRRVELNFPEVNPPRQVEKQPPAPPARQPEQGPPQAVAEEPLPALAWISAGVGVVGLAGATVFWLSAEQLRQDLLARGCAPSCPGDDADSIKQRRVAGDVLLGVGLLGASVFGYYWLSQPSAGPVAAPLVGGGWAGWQQRF